MGDAWSFERRATLEAREECDQKAWAAVNYTMSEIWKVNTNFQDFYLEPFVVKNDIFALITK